mmetsp:Transcript_20478/g.30029  ORF Transcript_20478/g.30029 Transcript_20478/m.30029 type:complete len:96 (+) Transcript_20478:697-984(+)
MLNLGKMIQNSQIVLMGERKNYKEVLNTLRETTTGMTMLIPKTAGGTYTVGSSLEVENMMSKKRFLSSPLPEKHTCCPNRHILELNLFGTREITG